VERQLGEDEPDPEPDTRTHCEKCGGRLPTCRVVEVILPTDEQAAETLAILAEATGLDADGVIRMLEMNQRRERHER
jgi:hypothetical protein